MGLLTQREKKPQIETTSVTIPVCVLNWQYTILRRCYHTDFANSLKYSITCNSQLAVLQTLILTKEECSPIGAVDISLNENCLHAKYQASEFFDILIVCVV